MIKHLLAAGFLSIFFLEVTAQNSFDAIRSNAQIVQGTARFNAMGGATSALGADFSHASVNPAGLGFYRASEVAMSTALNTHVSQTTYNGNTNRENDVRLNLNSLSFVHSSPPSSDNSLLSYAWGFGYNRTATYQRSYEISGDNPGSSVLDEMTFDLNYPSPIDPDLINLDPSLAFSSALAWNTYLIDYDSNALTEQYYHANPFYEGTQAYTVDIEGSTGDYLFSGAINYDNRLFLGATLGFAIYNYTLNTRYEENVPLTSGTTQLKDFRYNSELNISGSNTRLRLGAIYRANDLLRMGLAYHFSHTTRTEDRFEYAVDSRFDNGDTWESASLPGDWSYTMRNPGRVITSLGITLKKTAAFALEYEYSDFSKVRFNQPDGLYDYAPENTDISNELRATHNVRAGAEYRLGTLTFRGGVRYYMSPFRDTRQYGDTYMYSTGVGMRNKNVFLDITYQLTQRNENTYMYDRAFATPAQSNLSSHSVLVSLGFKWK